ncbi:small glutamine-rich tetratricopeptide repeat-containing 2 [Fusarium albosuccineum]|uniref:Small glutamine-rich tetratricopeptide repeat-containing 2 n=1 Tax=Fusarium albosuccineum TaxID=1237068 RepID=A0A8H4PB84_9HYPO|nr:small glutamine-rich tetratricopeptide repeat-containing 2 [Fusarium albosuccineum]
MAQTEALWSIYEELIRSKCGDDQTTSDEAIRLKSRLQEVKKVIEAKTKGSLRIEHVPATEPGARVRVGVVWEGEDEPSTSTTQRLPHKSLGIYYQKELSHSSFKTNGQQHMWLDAEAEPTYAGTIPGTVTPEGFGFGFQEAHSSKKSADHTSVNTKELVPVKENKILRRIDEMRRGIRLDERNQEQQEADLKEFTSDAFKSKTPNQETRLDPAQQLTTLTSLLGRSDIFTDFTTKTSISSEWASVKSVNHGKWRLLWQIILAKELALLLGSPPQTPSSELPQSVRAALIIQDLWLQNVEVVMEEMPVSFSGVGKLTATDEVKTRAEEYKKKGDDAMEKQQWKDAKEFYTKAIELDLRSVTYRAARPTADLRLNNWANAAQDALIATRLEPKYVQAWNLLGAAWKLGGNDVRALAAYERAVQMAGPKATDQMRQDLEEVKAKVSELSSPQPGQNQVARDQALKILADQQWDTFLHPTRLQSHCHESQVEGLVCFAEHIKWPYLDELRDCAKGAWKKTTTGSIDSCLVQDWLLGLTLPGKWVALKLMACVVEMSPSIDRIRLADSYHHGLSLPQCSYWRSRSVLGRVLGAWPGVTSLCGWVGPCPPVVLDHPMSKEKISAYTLVHAKPIDLSKYSGSSAMSTDYRLAHWKPGINEDLGAYSDDISNQNRWVVPQPPIRELKPVAVKSIRLKQISSRTSVNERDVEYRASIDFSFVVRKLVPLTRVITYTLFTNPIFVSLPPCHGGTRNGHEVHVRELQKDKTLVVPVHQMKDLEGKYKDGGLIVINATCAGGDIMARAWCAEKGRNAAVRREGGPCYACATRAASKSGLDFGVLIWAS